MHICAVRLTVCLAHVHISPVKPRLIRGCCGDAGKDAAALLKSKIQNVPVTCTVKDKDQYGREVASCQAKGVGDIGQLMVSEGYAVAYRYLAEIACTCCIMLWWLVTLCTMACCCFVQAVLQAVRAS